MKIHCECGEFIHDQTDGLPNKAHFVSDQDWLGVFDKIDEVVSAVAAGRMTADGAQMAIRRIHLAVTRLMYQCRECGRLFVDDPQHRSNIYAPASATDSREILRSIRPA